MGVSGYGSTKANSGRPSGWQHGPTCTIRVPKIFAEKLLEIAKAIDHGLDEPLIIQPETLKVCSQAKREKLALSHVRIYVQGKHKVIRVQELYDLLQLMLENS